MGQIFYSQVDSNLQIELNARAKSATDRTNKSLDYMLGKIANVALVAYKNQDTKDRDTKDILYTLGGISTQQGNFLPAGFLTDDNLVYKSNKSNTNTYKIPPFITSCDVSTNDHSFALLNTATVNISISDPKRDIDLMESIFARPGRALTLRIVHPESAIIAAGNLNPSTIQPAIPLGSNTNNNKINVFEFDGVLTSFNLSYITDGTISLTVHMRGTSNVYTDVTMLTDPSKNDVTKHTEQLTSDFYEKIYDEVKSSLDQLYNGETTIQLAYTSLPDTDEFFELQGMDDNWHIRTNCMWGEQEHYYVQLGLLVKYLNRYILSKQRKFTPKAFIISNDTYCFSNYYEHLTSADPENILIATADVYGKDLNTNEDRHFISRKRSFKTNTDNDPFTDSPFHDESKSLSYPTRIFINTNLIKSILIAETKNNKIMKVGEFLTHLSKKINEATGGAIDLKLVSHPDNPDYLLFTDRNFLGDKKSVIPYNVPMMSDHARGTLVRDFKFEAKLPADMQSLMYTVANSDNISEEQIAPYMHYMYNNATKTRITFAGITSEVTLDENIPDSKPESELIVTYKLSHDKYLKALNKAKQEFGDTKKNESKQAQLIGALQKYIQFPTPDIKTSAQIQSPIYPYEVEFTIDGINGLRYGNSLEFDVLPNKYKNDTTFSIKSITHNVDTTGEWTTVVRCLMQTRFDQ